MIINVIAKILIVIRTIMLVCLMAYGLYVTLAWFGEVVGLTPAVRGTPTRVQYSCTEDTLDQACALTFGDGSGE